MDRMNWLFDLLRFVEIRETHKTQYVVSCSHHQNVHLIAHTLVIFISLFNCQPFALSICRSYLIQTIRHLQHIHTYVCISNESKIISMPSIQYM